MIPEPDGDDILLLTPARPSRADAVKNRALLLETARALFDRYGVEAVSMSAIAEAAGVGKGTLYRHFASKSALCLSLLDEDQRELQNRTFDRLRSHRDPAANLAWFLREVVAFVDRHIAFLRAEELADGPASLEHPAHAWWRVTIRSLLGQTGATGDLDYAADTLYIMVSAHTVGFQRFALGYDRERIERGLLATLDRLIR